jgi:diamine N-acetyltransferase
MSSAVSLKRWEALSASEQAAVLRLRVTEQQIEFAGTVERSVQACRDDHANEAAGLAIVQAGDVLGFLVLKRGSRAPAWAGPRSATVSALRIDLAQQGRGLGAAALTALPGWVAEHWPESSELILSVDEENYAARSAYAKAGFLDLGKRDEGRIGWVRYMAKPVQILA